MTRVDSRLPPNDVGRIRPSAEKRAGMTILRSFAEPVLSRRSAQDDDEGLSMTESLTGFKQLPKVADE